MGRSLRPNEFKVVICGGVVVVVKNKSTSPSAVPFQTKSVSLVCGSVPPLIGFVGLRVRPTFTKSITFEVSWVGSTSPSADVGHLHQKYYISSQLGWLDFTLCG
jgi:hypothetical protein